MGRRFDFPCETIFQDFNVVVLSVVDDVLVDGDDFRSLVHRTFVLMVLNLFLLALLSTANVKDQ